ncbi:D-2-hydroxyacid dehydrogenase [Ichthyobacterium seriolicida]|uniref:D-3-phosphoglycerate dehydrogenase n=1 Tax=Ichthyobacterium seriolicida TaxID=242600 RepID=A0A1J1ECK4_9FLAO|nr:D-2-hydroxyacid dehydrogenase [Ichthyobacterium seriolicida]BAV95240.1 D-3-phosphoglycerate dehydrogenase [Ichthyobacterium seriolicida]
MVKVLANDGISSVGEKKLRESGFDIITQSVKQDDLIDFINKEEISVLLVRSSTKVKRDIIDNCKSIKLIGRGGVGMDNIDVDYARDKGIRVINTPLASSNSVAELVFSHIFSMVRNLHQSNRDMPLEGDTHFKSLKKRYASGIELRGKTIGVIGVGRIGIGVVKIAVGIGMNVITHDKNVDEISFDMDFFDGRKLPFKIKTSTKDEVLKNSDFITLHVPADEKNRSLIGSKEISMMKKGSGIVNASRGGTIDEKALLKAIEEDHISFAGLDVFENEPTPDIKVLMNPKISLSPHIGASTLEAQDRIGEELADEIINMFKKDLHIKC